MRQVLSAVCAALILITLTSCGRGANALNIAITTNPGTVAGGATFVFEATTTNATSQGSGVTWTLALNEETNGNLTTPCDAQCGALVNTGTTVTGTGTSGSTTYYNLLTTTTYTAPLDPPTPNSLVLTATAATDSSLYQEITFTIGAPAIVVKIPNKITTIAPGSAPVTLTADVQFDTSNAGVNWTLNADGSSCSPACGSLSNIGKFNVTYTPPATLPTSPNNTPTITATSITTSTSTDFDTFTIEGSQTQPVIVTITNPFTTIDAGSTGVTLHARVTNDEESEGVTWTISPTSGTGALSAATAYSVLYTPPNQASEPPDNTPTITATSVANPNSTAQFTFTIEPASNNAACTLSGSYAFAISGKDSSGQPLAALGRVTIDSGKITAGSLDINDAFLPSQLPSLTGTCSSESVKGFAGVQSRGIIAFDNVPSGFAQAPRFEYVMFGGSGTSDSGSSNDSSSSSISSGTIREIDAGKTQTSGTIYLQDAAPANASGTSSATSSPTSSTIAPADGAFALQLADIAASPTQNLAGQFQLAFRNGAGIVTDGSANITSGMRTISTGLAWSGTATAPDATGRGTLTFNFTNGAPHTVTSVSGAATRSFAYIIVSPKLLLLLQSSTPGAPPPHFAAPSPDQSTSLQIGAATLSP